MLETDYAKLFDNYIYMPEGDKELKHEWMLHNKTRRGVYVLFDKAMQVMYVGSTGNLQQRIAEHYYDGVLKQYADRVAFLGWKECDDKEQRFKLEIQYIKQLRPQLNVAHNRG